jgi:hypothetical protein
MKLVTTNSDLMEYGRKYHFYRNTENDTIVCTTIYKGKMVRGIAKCSPEDNFDIELGKKLAYLRCKKKFARKKLKHAHNAYKEAFLVEAKARTNLAKAAEFVNDSDYLLDMVTKELVCLERKLGIED